MLCSPTPLSQCPVPGEAAPSLAAGEAILQAVWPELRVRGCGFNPLPALKPAKFFPSVSLLFAWTYASW